MNQCDYYIWVGLYEWAEAGEEGDDPWDKWDNFPWIKLQDRTLAAAIEGGNKPGCGPLAGRRLKWLDVSYVYVLGQLAAGNIEHLF